MTVSIDITELVTKLNNIVAYSEGFLTEVQVQRKNFNNEIGNYLIPVLGQYIDGLARVSPESLHHVYEWGQVGVASARLFEFNMVATATNITFNGTFLESTSTSPTGTVPFVDKARVMERGITIVIEPKDAQALVFEAPDGSTVFTTSPVVVENPGGEAVAGSFEAAVDSFFTTYVTKEILWPILKKMERAKEYKQLFAAGAKGGRSTGQQAARKYMNGATDGIV